MVDFHSTSFGRGFDVVILIHFDYLFICFLFVCLVVCLFIYSFIDSLIHLFSFFFLSLFLLLSVVVFLAGERLYSVILEFIFFFL